jgi:AraC family transcriptional regulator of adaptative response/methylated-DNA-[protein]-cysteine methyltransferase
MDTTEPNFVNSRDFARIARAIRFIDENFRRQPRLAEIAAAAGLSVFHFNRLFRRWAGVTPKQYLAFVTGQAAKGVLSEQPSVLDAAYEVGLSGPGRLHDLIVAVDAVTPGEWKALGRGIAIRYGFSDTPFGRALIAQTERGICHLAFVEQDHDKAALSELRERWPQAQFLSDDAQAHEIATRIWNPDASTGATPLRLAVTGTNFQLKVWQALLDIGNRGYTTYAALAGAIGQAGSQRAVGGAVGANPIGWLIPCHNVLRKDGEIGGYQWGPDRKRAMLAWESLAGQRPQPQNALSSARQAT